MRKDFFCGPCIFRHCKSHPCATERRLAGSSNHPFIDLTLEYSTALVGFGLQCKTYIWTVFQSAFGYVPFKVFFIDGPLLIWETIRVGILTAAIDGIIAFINRDVATGIKSMLLLAFYIILLGRFFWNLSQGRQVSLNLESTHSCTDYNLGV